MPYRFLDHPADIRLQITAPTLKQLFQEALSGLMAAMKPKEKKDGRTIRRKVKMTAPDRTSLLVDFLGETLFLSQTRREIYSEVSFKKFLKNRLDAELRGRPAESFGEDVKAVTYHEAEIRKNPDGNWKTNLIFDI